MTRHERYYSRFQRLSDSLFVATATHQLLGGRDGVVKFARFRGTTSSSLATGMHAKKYVRTVEYAKKLDVACAHTRSDNVDSSRWLQIERCPPDCGILCACSLLATVSWPWSWALHASGESASRRQQGVWLFQQQQTRYRSRYG